MNVAIQNEKIMRIRSQTMNHNHFMLMSSGRVKKNVFVEEEKIILLEEKFRRRVRQFSSVLSDFDDSREDKFEYKN